MKEYFESIENNLAVFGILIKDRKEKKKND